MYYDNILIVGSGKFAYECAKIVAKIHNSVGVLEYRINRNISLLGSLCSKNNLSYGEMNGDIYSLLKDGESYLIISAFNTYIFKSKVINMSNIDIINFHPSLLPKHPGRNAEAWAIYEGDSKTGITWHMVTEAIDQGDIIEQAEIDIDDHTTSLSLMIKQNKIGIEIFEKIIPIILNGNIPTKKQYAKEFVYHRSNDVPNNGYLEPCWDDFLKSQFLRAMDYGKLRILGVPRIKIDHKEYEWSSYRIVDKSVLNEHRSCDIIIEGVKKNFVLENVKEV